MRIKTETISEWLIRVNAWHRWFAWYPVMVGSYLTWLETVERSRDPDYYGCTWRYRKPDIQ